MQLFQHGPVFKVQIGLHCPPARTRRIGRRNGQIVTVNQPALQARAPPVLADHKARRLHIDRNGDERRLGRRNPKRSELGALGKKRTRQLQHGGAVSRQIGHAELGIDHCLQARFTTGGFIAGFGIEILGNQIGP